MNNEKIVLYDYYKNSVVMEGTVQEVREWLMSTIAPIKVFRFWKEDYGRKFVYDFEHLYYTTLPLWDEDEIIQ